MRRHVASPRDMQGIRASVMAVRAELPAAPDRETTWTSYCKCYCSFEYALRLVLP